MPGNVLPSKDIATKMLRKLREIRHVEERIIKIYPTDVMVTPVHLHIGQEAVPVGLCANLNPTDKLFFAHRTHGPALAKGLEIKKLMAELYGRTTGASHGFGGSMHLVDPANGMLGSSAIVGGGITLGVGAALASKLKNQDWIAVSYFGDGALDSGPFWESINFAALKKLPVLFLCEDNGLSNVMTKKEHLYPEIEKITKEFMPTFVADGTDVLSVYETAKTALEHVRTKRSPAFLLCPTKRWMKHQGVEYDDLDFNPVDRKRDDPILKLEKVMLDNKMISPAEIEEMVSDVEREIDAAVEFAENSPFPDERDLVREV